MCGIHGIITTDTYLRNGDDFMSDAFLANQVRGTHSSGIYQVRNGKISTYKKATNASNFLEDPQTKPLINGAGSANLTVGHVRHATAGSITDENAHPFLVTREDGSQLVGVHNGTLKEWKHKDGGKDHSVDSAWAFETLARENADAFEYFTGAYALVWYDSKHPDCVFMARNDQRPMHYTVTKDQKSMLFASELGMLGWIAERNRMELHVEKGGSGFFYLRPGMIYKFSLKEVGKYESWEAPKYDPATGEAPSTYSWPNHYGKRYVQGSSLYDDEDSYSPWRPQTSGYVNRPYGQKAVMEHIKESLREARNERFKENNKVVVTDADTGEQLNAEVISSDDMELRLAEAIKTSIEEWEKERAAPKQGSVWDHLLFNPQATRSPNDASATRKEIKSVRDMGMYGQMVMFEGILFDEETAVVFGTFQVLHENSGEVLTYDGEYRFATAKEAAKYVDKTTLFTIVGWNSGLSGQYPTFVLTPATKPQINVVRERLERVDLSAKVFH